MAGFLLDRTQRFFEVSLSFLVAGVVFLALFTFAVQVPADQGYGCGSRAKRERTAPTVIASKHTRNYIRN